jgi:dynein heavy chain 1
LQKPIQLIKQKVEEIQSYVADWLRFQSLWDLNPETIYTRLGEELSQWSQLLSAIKQSRATFDTADTKKDFGVCLVVYAGVQGKVTAKYDSWQRDILAKYAGKLGHRMSDFYGTLAKARQALEAQTLNGSSTAQAVGFITFVQDLNRKTEGWSTQLAEFVEGQQVLETQRYAFADDWLNIDRVHGEWHLFNDILRRKNGVIQDQFAALQLKISAEVEAMDERISSLRQDWDTKKPIQGSIKPELALDTIENFSSRLVKILEGQDLLGKAQDALNLSRHREDVLSPMGDEIRDLKTVWTALLGISIRLDELRETLWTAVNPRKLRQTLDSILVSMKEMPSRMRQYAAYEHFADIIKALMKGNSIVSDLKSDSLRDRHWRTLFQVLRIASPYRSSTMTLGQIWDLNTAKNEKAIKDIILQAQGEMALEEYVRQVKDTWSTYTLDLINYRNKCRLIKGWDELFTTCRDQVTSLTSMRASPYYKIFEEEASALEDKLNRIHSLFDIWVDVQRQWVYLEGVFAGNADIKHLLPVESSRFNSINAEFLGTMAKVSKSPLVFDVVGINSIHKTMERLADALIKIQKGLGEYLERERAAFPRYFFLGDEDLLEIIGNSRDISRVSKHLGKMFAGIRHIHLNDDEDAIIAISSKESERIDLLDPIRLNEKLKVNEWLSALETGARSTLRQLLRTTCDQLADFYVMDQPVAASPLLSWIENFPDQLVILAVQILWTDSVERQLTGTGSLDEVLDLTLALLDTLSAIVLQDLGPLVRRKCEHLIVELAHQRDVLRALLDAAVTASSAFDWQKQMRFYHHTAENDVDKAVSVKMADAVLPYGFEYLGIPERLVQTPLTDKCYLILTQAMHSQCGGSPFGPAGTGQWFRSSF